MIRDNIISIDMLKPIRYEDIKDLDYKRISLLVRIRMIEGLIKLRNRRREQEKNYYRLSEKYIMIDKQMEEELEVLKAKALKSNIRKELF